MDLNQNRINLTLIATVSVAIFLFGINAGWKQVEDQAYFIDNPLFSNISIKQRLIWCWTQHPESNYTPITWSLAVILQTISKGPFIMHLVCLALHTFNSCLAYKICREVKLSTAVSLIAILIFTVHPLRVESVIWASSLKGLLSTFFALIAILAYIKEKTKLSLFSYLLCILSKQTLVALPLLLLLEIKEVKSRKIAIASATILSAIGVAIAMWANTDNPSPFISDTFTIKPLTAIATIGHYTYKTLVPIDLVIDYPLLVTWYNLSIGGFVILLTLWSLNRVRIGNANIAEMSLITYTGLLVPVSGIIATPLEFAADRLSYFPSLFLIVAIVCACVSLHHHFLKIFTVVAMPLAFLSLVQIHLWKNFRQQCEASLQSYPNHYFSLLSLAHLDANGGNVTNAKKLAYQLTKVHSERLSGWDTLIKIHLGERNLDLANKELIRAYQEAPDLTHDIDYLSIDVAKAEGDLAKTLEILDKLEASGADLLTVLYRRIQAYIEFDALDSAKLAAEEAMIKLPNSTALKKLYQHILARLAPSSK